MKKYFSIVFILFLFSCKKQLTEKVYSDITANTFYKTATDANAALYGVYNNLNRSPFSDWDTHLYTLVFMPNRYVISRVGFRKVYGNFTYGVSDDALTTVWRSGFLTINRANAVINRVPGITMDETQKKQIVAEAKFLRALTYFNLVRLFGGVPLKTTETTSLDDINVPRSTAIAVYDLIISDLKEAETTLSDKRIASEKGRATSGSASALLGRVYLTMAGSPLKQADKWAMAKDKFKFIIDNKARWGYDLMPDYADIFSLTKENNQEVIFAIQNSWQTGQGSVLAFWNAPPNSTFATANGQYHYGFTTEFRDLFTATDTIRRNVTLVNSYVDIKGQTITYNAPGVPHGYKDPNGIALGKFKDGGGGAPTNVNHKNDVLVIRYADILLMYAEAENEVSGPTAGALDALNLVRARARTSQLTGLNQASFRDAVYMERILELSGELTEFFDIQRLGKLEETIKNSPEAKLTNTAYNAKFLLYPIPQLELDANTKIEQADQNPGW